MSRIGKAPIALPRGVTVAVEADNTVTVKGPRGELRRRFDRAVIVRSDDGQVTVSRASDQRQHRALHGLSRALLANMVKGVTEGHSKTLLVTGIGFRCEQVGEMVNLQVGYAHPVLVAPEPGLQLRVEGPNRLTVSGNDKELVGDQAARIRAIRPIKPYIFRGDFQGIRYDGEQPRRKAGKQGV